MIFFRLVNMSVTHSYRPSAFEKERHYRLTAEGITIECESFQPVFISYDSINAIHLTFDPSRFDTNKYVCKMYYNREVTWISSSHYVSMGTFENRGASYRAFLMALHQNLSHFQSIRYKRGIAYAKYYALLFLVFVTIFLVSWALISWLPSSNGLILFRLMVFAYMIWASYGYFKKNKPGNYDPLSIPADLLPDA